ncbi:hypothetical protein GCM10027566_16740 [Arachidicoccus ginsenosidivorans]|uniref:Uncharacterized protein n=1 Tax=Arachidicoccus ginsenosidivorans TaxID=496057 RepID=A0A5B8VH47_9BACT|nr:hypothetical protein [Arachidicoccus ginsenosidivorans]QEC70844.1 hypothetical protein FSB73_03280 [Arachidicoccus ginsenosidivorans]
MSLIASSILIVASPSKFVPECRTSKSPCKLDGNFAPSFTNNINLLQDKAYDVLGQVESKKISKRRSSTSAYTTTPLDTENYDYNILGWLLGLNRGYVKDAGTNSTTATATTAAVSSEEIRKIGVCLFGMCWAGFC